MPVCNGISTRLTKPAVFDDLPQCAKFSLQPDQQECRNGDRESCRRNILDAHQLVAIGVVVVVMSSALFNAVGVTE